MLPCLFFQLGPHNPLMQSYSACVLLGRCTKSHMGTSITPMVSVVGYGMDFRGTVVRFSVGTYTLYR
jgi:hypothetical protein